MCPDCNRSLAMVSVGACGAWDMGFGIRDVTAAPQDACTAGHPPQAHTRLQSLCQVLENGRALAQHHGSCLNRTARSRWDGRRPARATVGCAGSGHTGSKYCSSPQRATAAASPGKQSLENCICAVRRKITQHPPALRNPTTSGKLTQIFADKKELEGKSQD